MDSITQAALGAAIGELMLGKRLGNRAIAWGALFGTLPDLDILLSPLLDTAGNLWWHRGPSHSLLVMIVASILLGPRLAKRWKREKVSPTLAGWFVFLAWSTHVLIDCFNVYGTEVLWPFANTRVGFNNLFIIDLCFTLPLLITLVKIYFLKHKKQLLQRRKLNLWGLGIASAYVLISVGMKSIASSDFESDLSRRNISFLRRMEAPTPFNIFLWRSVVDLGDSFWVGYRSIFESKDTPIRWTIYPKGENSLIGHHQMREVKTIKQFADGWWIARPHVKGAWMADMRFQEIRHWGTRGGMVDYKMPFSWDIVPTASRDRLQKLRPSRDGSLETLKHMVLRLSGDHESWDTPARLSGATGRFPETLDVVN